MAVKAKIFVECDICGATSSDIVTVVKNSVKLPDGWVHNTSLGIMCESCKKRLDTEKDAYSKIYCNETIPPLAVVKEYYDSNNVRSLKHEHENRADSN